MSEAVRSLLSRGAARKAIARFGLEVRCVLCHWAGRHRPETEGRLRARACPTCRFESLRSVAWMKHHPERLAKILAEHRAGEAVFGPF